MPGSILNRLIFWELLKVFLMALCALTALLVAAGLIQQASQMGLSLMQVVRAIPLFVPNTLPYTIPATTLFASCVVYGRLAHDNEVVAIKAAGVHLATILKPALLLGILTTAVTLALSHTVIPMSQQILFTQLTQDPEELVYNMLRRDRCLRHQHLPYVLYVRDVQGKRLIDLVLKKRAKVKDVKTGQELFFGYDFIARAREARLRVDPADGKMYIDPDRFVMYDKNTSGTTASTGPFQMDLPETVIGRDKVRTTSLTWDEIPPRVAVLREEEQEKERVRQEIRNQAESIRDPDLRQIALAQDRHYALQLEAIQRSIRSTEAELYFRPALAFGCLIFALLGCPVGIWANRADYLSTFVICFLPALFVYYPLLLAGTGMGKDGKVSLALGCWLGNIAVGAFALVLNARLLRR